MIRRLARAKVNLFLHVVGRRADGYHLLESLAVFPPIGDVVEVERATGGLSLALAGPFKDDLGSGGDNLALSAAEALRAEAGVAAGAAILLEKNLPVASGVGGGSSDAAATLLALGALWGVDLAPGALDRLALSLGADAPVCLRAPAPTFMAGVGEALSPAPPLPDAAILLVNPGVKIATAEAFRALERRDNPPAGPAPARFGGFADLLEWLRGLRNDLEAPAIALRPEVARTLDALRALPGCALARMSGSGATCFGLFESAARANEAAAALRRASPAAWIAAAPLADAEID